MKKPAGISRTAYLKLVEQKGQQVDPEKLPVEYEDLPLDAQLAYSIYCRLGNRAESNIGFIGKDYTNLPLYIKSYGIYDIEFLLDLLLALEIHFIDESAKELKKIMDKYSSKNK